MLVRDPATDQTVFARVKVPTEILPRFVSLQQPDGAATLLVPLEDVIAHHLDALFPGMEIADYNVFRVTRDADLEVSDDAADLLQAVEDELRRRRFGEIVRVEVGRRLLAATAVGAFGAARRRRRRGLPGRRAARHGRAVAARAPARTRRAARGAVAGDHASAPAAPRGRAPGRARRDARRRPARAPSLRLLRHVGRALRRAGRGRPQRARDQADRLPHERRLAARAGADRRDRARQAGGRAGRAQGALRRGHEHPLGQGDGGGGRARRLRPAVAEDARQVRAGRAPRGRRRAQLRAHRHRQLPLGDGAPVHRLRPVHDRRADRRRRRRHVQLPHRLRAPAALPPAC